MYISMYMYTHTSTHPPPIQTFICTPRTHAQKHVIQDTPQIIHKSNFSSFQNLIINNHKYKISLFTTSTILNTRIHNLPPTLV